MITIYGKDNQPKSDKLTNMPIGEGSIRKYTLMKEDYILLKFSLDENIPLVIGDYVNLEGDDDTTHLFVVDRNYYPTYNKETDGWDYSVQINAFYHQWKNRIFMSNPKKGAAEASFSLTDTINRHTELIKTNLEHAGFDYKGTAFEVYPSAEIAKKGLKPITYSATTIYAALDAIASAFECEWWIDGSSIHFGIRKNELSEGEQPLVLTLNEELASASTSQSQGVHATRLYAFGGTTNVPKHYRDKLEFTPNTTYMKDGVIKGVMDATKPVYTDWFRGERKKKEAFSQSIPNGIGDRVVPLKKPMPTQEVEGHVENFLLNISPKYCTWYGDKDVEKDIPLDINIGASQGNGESRDIVSHSVSFKVGDLTAGTGNKVSLNSTASGYIDENGIYRKYSDNTLSDTYKVKAGKSYIVQCNLIMQAPKTFVPVGFVAEKEYGLQGVVYSAYEEYTDGKLVCYAYNMPSDGYIIARGAATYVYEVNGIDDIHFELGSRGFSINSQYEPYDSIKISSSYKNDGEVYTNKDSTSTITQFIKFGFDYSTQFDFAYQPTAESVETKIKLNDEKSEKEYTAIINPEFKDNGTQIQIEGYEGDWGDIKTYYFPYILLSKVRGEYFTIEEGGVQSGVVQKNIMLPKGKDYVQADGVADTDVVESIVVYDWIYPKSELVVKHVEPFDKWPVEEGEETTYVTTYDIVLSIDGWRWDDFVVGENLYMVFQDNKASGLRFEVNEIGINNITYADKLKGIENPVIFRLVPNEDYVVWIPNDATIPATGDKVILDGIDITYFDTNAVSDAEAEVLKQAELDIKETAKENIVADITLFSDYAYEHGRFNLGQQVTLKGCISIDFESRIIGFEEKLDIPYGAPKYVVGDSNHYSVFGNIENKLNEVKKESSIVIGGTGGGSSVPIIKSKDNTRPTDANVFSALRTDENFLHTKEDDTVEGNITFSKDIKVGGTTTTNSLSAKTANVGQMAVSGDATIDGTTKLGNDLTIGSYFEQGDIIQGARVTKEGLASFAAIKSPSMQIYELIYNRKTAVQGDFVFSDGDTIDKVEYIKDGNVADSSDYDYIRLTMREQYQGYMSSFKADDILYSNVNLIGASGEAATTGKCWMWVLQEDNSYGVTPVDGLVVNVAWYGNDDKVVPNGVNMLPTEHMVVTRHGNRTVTSRQHVFLISSETGALIQLMGVDSPIIKTEGSYGAVLGLLPDTLKEYVRSQGATYINDNQPYLYARGVIVQDLIRLNYQGKPILEANYRGYWSAEEAVNNPYRVTSSTFDTVTHKGALWACQTSYTKNEPADNVGDWLKMVYVEENSYRFSLIPSANSIHYYTATDKLSVSQVEVKVGVQTYAKYFEIEDQSVLNSYNLGVYYAIDGTGERVKLNISPVGVFVMEDGSTIISTEGGSGLSLDGDDIDVSAIQDNITLYLVDEITNEDKDKFVIQVTSDGQKGDKGADGAGYSLYIDKPIISHPIDAETKKTIGSQSVKVKVIINNNGEYMTTEDHTLVVSSNGTGVTCTQSQWEEYWEVTINIQDGVDTTTISKDIDLIVSGGGLKSGIQGKIAIAYLERGMAGRDGALPYACGTWDENVSYAAATDITPFVLHKGEYYVRTSQPYEIDIYDKEIHNEPDLDVAENLGCWRRMDKYEAIYTKMLFADYARLAQAVFFGDYMFSERGVNKKGEQGVYDAYVDDQLGNLPMFTDTRKLSGSFTPNLFMDLRSGEMKANKLSSPFSLFNVTSDNIGKTINLEDSFNVTIAMHPDNYGNAQPSILAMPNPTKITALDGTILEDMPWSADGAYSTIIYQSDDTFMSIKGENDVEYPSYISILCADGRVLDRRSYRPFDGQIVYAPTGYSTSKPLDNEGYFVVNGCYTKFLLLLPSDIVKLRQSNELMSNGTTRTLWYVENQTDFNRVKFKLSVCPDMVYNEDGTLEENRKYYTFDHTSDSGWYYDSKSAWCSAYLFDKVAGQEVTMGADISVKTQEDKEINIVNYLG